jgi:hypothetical protein
MRRLFDLRAAEQERALQEIQAAIQVLLLKSQELAEGIVLQFSVVRKEAACSLWQGPGDVQEQGYVFG